MQNLMFYPEIRLSVHRCVLVPNVSSLCSRLPVFPSIFLPISFLRSHIIKVLWYIITVHIYLKSPLGEYAASPPLLSLRIIKCYYLHPVQLLSQPLITSTALNKKTSLTTSEANWKQKKKKKKRRVNEDVQLWIFDLTFQLFCWIQILENFLFSWLFPPNCQPEVKFYFLFLVKTTNQHKCCFF